MFARQLADQASHFADRFAELQEATAALKEAATNGVVAPPTTEAYNDRRALLELRRQIEMLKLKADFYEMKIKTRIGACDGIAGVATWMASPRSFFSQAAFKAAHPDIYTQFSMPRPGRVFRLAKAR